MRKDQEYYRAMVSYDRKLKELTSDIWENEYMQYEEDEKVGK